MKKMIVIVAAIMFAVSNSASAKEIWDIDNEDIFVITPQIQTAFDIAAATDSPAGRIRSLRESCAKLSQAGQDIQALVAIGTIWAQSIAATVPESERENFLKELRVLVSFSQEGQLEYLPGFVIARNKVMQLN